ncbi:MAG: hypothetical protein AAGC60_25780 [Acidobacteriota bacterium]
MKPERIQLVVDEHDGWGYLEPVVGLHRRYRFEHHALAEAFARYCRDAAGVFELEVHATVRGQVLDLLVLPDETTSEAKVQSFLRATALTSESGFGSLDSTDLSDLPPPDAEETDAASRLPSRDTNDDDTAPSERPSGEPTPESG